MISSVGSLIGLAHGLAVLNYTLGVLFQTLPIPRKELKSWGPTLMWDAVVTEFALGSVSLVSLTISWISAAIKESLGLPFSSNSLAITTVIAQLTSLDASLLLLITGLSFTVVLVSIAQANKRT